MRSTILNEMARRRRARQGMTLVEIMVVIAILGTLMGIVAFNVADRFAEAKVETTRLQIRQIEQGLALYAAKKNGKFPSTSDGLEAAKKHFPDGEVPKDGWDNEFLYFSPGTQSGKAYEIVSLGADGAEGGEGVDADLKSWDLDGEGE